MFTTTLGDEVSVGVGGVILSISTLGVGVGDITLSGSTLGVGVGDIISLGVGVRKALGVGEVGEVGAVITQDHQGVGVGLRVVAVEPLESSKELGMNESPVVLVVAVGSKEFGVGDGLGSGKGTESGIGSGLGSGNGSGSDSG